MSPPTPNAPTMIPIVPKPRPKRWCRSAAHIGKGAPRDGGLDEHGKDDQPCPGIGEHADIVGEKAARLLRATPSRSRAWIEAKLEQEARGRQREHGRIGRAHAELQSLRQLVCRLLL